MKDRRDYHRKYYAKKRQKLFDHLGGVCNVCGTTEKLEIDHIEPEKKSFTIHIHTPWDKAVDELKKCQLLCESHHLEKTITEKTGKLRGYGHGTRNGFKENKCQCDICLVAKAKWVEERKVKYRKEKVYTQGPYFLPTEHGTQLRYRRGCKCKECKAAQSASVKEYRATGSYPPSNQHYLDYRRVETKLDQPAETSSESMDSSTETG